MWDLLNAYQYSIARNGTEPQQPTRVLTRGLRIIDTLADDRDGLPLTKIARKAGLPKSSTHRPLQTLVQEGFATQEGDSSRYRLSLKPLSLSSNLIRPSNAGDTTIIFVRLHDVHWSV